MKDGTISYTRDTWPEPLQRAYNGKWGSDNLQQRSHIMDLLGKVELESQPKQPVP